MPNGPPDNSHMYRLGNSGDGREAWICPRLLIPLGQWLDSCFSVRVNFTMLTFPTGQMSAEHAEAAR